MRKTLLMFVPLLFLSFHSLFAGRLDDGVWRVSILASEISSAGNQPWSDDVHAGLGVGVAYAPTPSWDMELTLASQTHRSPLSRLFYVPSPNGAAGQTFVVTEFHEYRVMPVDLSVTRHFLTTQAIAPYVRAGVRYVNSPNDPSSLGFAAPVFPAENVIVPVASGFGFHNRLSAQAGAGVRVRLTSRTALRVEAARLLRSDAVDFDPLTHYAAGLSWRF
jgi:outer membrane protein W